MKTYKILTIATIIILVAILSIVTFGGVYKLKNYKIKNVIPDYTYGKEFSKSRFIEFKVDDSVKSTKIYDKDGNEILEEEEGIEYTEENGYTKIETKANSPENLTVENYKKAKKIMANRIKNLKIDEYDIKLNKEDGTIVIDVAEDDKTDQMISVLLLQAKLEVVDNETKEVLLDNSNIKSAKEYYEANKNGGADVYLELNLDKEGKAKLEEISKTYVATEIEKRDEKQETETIEEKETQEGTETEEIKPNEEIEKKEVAILFDDDILETKCFEQTVKDGVLKVKLKEVTTNEEFQRYYNAAAEIAKLINMGRMPITYTQINYVKDNSINVFNNKILVYSAVAIITLAVAFFIIKLKLKGILAFILEIRICGINSTFL